MTEECISRSKLLEDIERVYTAHYEQTQSQAIHDFYNAVCKRIKSAPAVGARKGKWRLLNYGKGTCSQCNFTQSNVWDYESEQRYCGVCGAEMSLPAEVAEYD
jgi:hypothetical protein